MFGDNRNPNIDVHTKQHILTQMYIYTHTHTYIYIYIYIYIYKQLIWYGHVERMDPTRLPKIMIH